MAQSHSNRSVERFTDVVQFIHAVEGAAPGDEVRLRYSLFDAKHLLVARKTGLGTLYLTAIDRGRSLPLSTEEYDLTELQSADAVRAVVGDAAERFLSLEYDSVEPEQLDVERIGG